ncbi:beta-propeller fold lactonase family protein [Arthrobacter cryoconiti]|uniref:Beta-propeller fold lactonase family protein n=1 Tax=Arthrobacter cryoconiti TaxID=748907 RepID=A0ABV8R6M2_9MICC|nr:beta-propeller fold lactonase family protein [Arthrobacter cryoconiti]MCC9066782.1 beta-propeller fold lactonase family protein [Arthrobacter cryoconiti]
MTSISVTTLTLGALVLSGCSAPSTPAASSETPVVSSPPAKAIAAFDGDITNNSLAVSPDEKTAVVSDSREKSILIYDLTDGKLRKKIEGFGTPRDIAFVNEGSEFVVSDSTLGTLRFYNTNDSSFKDEVVVGPGAFGTSVSPDGKTLYVNNEAHSSVTRVDIAARRAVDVLTGFSQPRQGIQASPDGKQVFVTNFQGDKVTVIDVASWKIVREISGFSKIRGISVSPDGGTLYAANSGRNSVSVVDTATGAISQDIAVGNDPYGASLSPDGKLLLASNKVDNTISVINASDNSVVKTIDGFKEPRQAIVFNKDQSTAYVLNKDLSIAKLNVSDLSVTQTISQ